MVILFLILVVIVSVILGFIVLVQNPKGGGLSGSIAGFSNQFMGVKQTTDVLEKGTWIFAAAIGVLCLVSTLFLSGSTATKVDIGAPTQSQSAPLNAPVVPVSPQK
jgi:preprotein translocase subunit SecG